MHGSFSRTNGWKYFKRGKAQSQQNKKALSWQDLERIAFGQMNMDVDVFYDMLPKHFWNKMDGFNDLENLRQRSEWERCRWQTAYLLMPHTGKGKTMKPTDLIKFDWDKTSKEVDFEKLKARAEYIKKLEEDGK